MADIYEVNNDDSMNRYQNIMGVPSRRRIIFGAACIVFISTLIVIAFSVMNKQNSSRLSYTAFNSAINISVDPCVNFYNFSCGLWWQKYQLRDTFALVQERINWDKRIIFENSKVSSDLPRVVNSAIQFYNICMERDDPENNDLDRELLLQNFDRIGGWPILNMSKWNESTFDWVKTNALLIKYFNVNAPIGVYSKETDKCPNKGVIYLKTSDVFENTDVWLDQKLYSVIKSLSNRLIDHNMYINVNNIVQSSYKWKELFSFSKNSSNPLFVTIEELSTEIPEVNWLSFIQLITNETFHEFDESVAINDTIAIESFDALKKVVGIMNSDTFTKLDLANLFGWFAIKDIWTLIPEASQNYMSLSKENEPVETYFANECFTAALDLFQCSFEYLFVKNISHAGIDGGEMLITYIKSAFQEIVQKSSWVDEETKNFALTKLNHIKDIIGFPSYLSNKIEFDNMYKNFPVMGNSTLECYFQIVQYYAKSKFRVLKVLNDQISAILPRPVTDVGAYYYVQKNTIVFPISLHNPPFYYPKGPWYLNFGAVGTIIGHEMMHAIDSFGCNGTNKASWPSNATSTVYQKHAECFKNQYTIYGSSGLLLNNGSHTLRENIADNAGLHAAYEAYKKHVTIAGPDLMYKTIKNYSPDQMFFIAYGTMWCSNNGRLKIEKDTHSVKEIRVNMAVSNSKYFASAFNCPKGSPMNPVKKCSIW